MPDRSSIDLTPDGVTRRERMLGDLLGELESLRRRRIARRRVSALAGACLLIGAGAWLTTIVCSPARTMPHAPDIAAVPPVQTPPAPMNAKEPTVRIQIVSTDPTVAQRWTVHTQAWPESGTVVRGGVTVTFLDVHGLLRELAAIGRPTGLVEMGGQYRFTRPITDPALDGG